MLKDRVMFMSGGSRGIGLSIATRAARDGVKVALMAKTAEPHPKLPGTIYTAAEEIEAAGGEALPIVGDIRDADAVDAAVAQTVERFGAVDIVVNNASAINLAPMRDLEVKRFDLMQQINARGTFVVTRACLPHLRESDHAHVLTLSPPLTAADRRWLGGHSAYTLSKLGMTLITLGVAADEAEAGIGANCLWPRSIIATAAVQNLLGGDEAMARSRVPEIVADAAYEILSRDPRECTGNTFIDDEVLAEAGITDLDRYAGTPDADVQLDIFVDGWPEPAASR
jgi:citronellol/citronellal dehydrogenase